MSAGIKLRVEWLLTLRRFHLASGVLRKRYFLVEAGCGFNQVVVAKVGTSDGSKFTTEMWIGSDEFGIRKEKKNYAGSEHTPRINKGKEDT
eukprot:1161448-Pelagomonas_calceolata.AAC.2